MQLRKFIFGAIIMFFTTLLGCSPQVQAPPSANPPTSQPVKITPPPQGNTETPVTAAVVPAKSQRKIAFVRNCGSELGWEIFTADADGSNIVDITNSRSRDLWPTWSPDGSKIAFQSSREWRGDSIYTMSADGSNVKCLTGGFSPAWSPEGTTIAYSTGKLGGTLDIFTMDINGNNQLPVAPIRKTPTTGVGSAQESASWFPDSHKIAYASNTAGLWQICDVTTNNPSPNYLTPDTSESKRYRICINNTCGFRFIGDGITYHNSFPVLSVSPDGKMIAFDYYNPMTTKRDIYLLTIDTGEVECLTCGLPTNSYFPTWSPDGSEIAFTYEIDGKPNIYIVDADGSNPTLLIENGMFPEWQR